MTCHCSGSGEPTRSAQEIPGHLPTPDPEALRRSETLLDQLRAEIGRDGWMSFERYMDRALYTPGLGYYAAGNPKFGPAGDFVTAPERSPLFARALAHQLMQVMAASAANILEVGPGSGALAADLLVALAELGCAPEHYALLEVSSSLRDRQAQRIAARAPESMTRVSWLDRLPERWTGLVIANEVVDAMPVARLHWREDGLYEQGVACDASGRLLASDRLADARLVAAARGIDVPVPYLSEVGRIGCAWVGEWGHRLERGALFIVDYGFPHHEYYHPQRAGGTLMCHYRHVARADPFLYPGLCDITAHVDFSALAAAGHAAGLDVMGYTSQAQFLLQCGLLEYVDQALQRDPVGAAKAGAEANMLISPAEMGELFKVIAFGRGVDTPLIGFMRGDLTHTL